MQRIRRAIILGLGAVAGMFVAYGSAAAYSSLCDVVGLAACDFAGPDAPLYQADVCWSGTVATPKTGSCPTGTTPYYVEHGEVDVTGAVLPYISLPDACAEGYCDPAPDPYPVTEQGGMCCTTTGNPPVTTCTSAVTDCTGDIVWCNNIGHDGDCYEIDE